mgnify:CR=1 FL=1
MKYFNTAKEIREAITSRVVVDFSTTAKEPFHDSDDNALNSGITAVWYFADGARLKINYQGSYKSDWTPSSDAEVWFTLFERGE